MKSRSFIYALLTVVSVLLVIGAIGFYEIISHSPLALLKGGTSAAPSATVFVPKQSPLTVSLLVNPSRLEALQQLETSPGKRSQKRTQLNQLKASLLRNTGLDYQRDILPWLGDEITVAVTSLDIDRDHTNGRQPGILLAATTEDVDASQELLEIFWQKQAIAGDNLTFEPYNGIDIIYKLTTDPNVPNLATAIVGSQFVLLANHPKVLKDALNNAQAANLNLKNSPNFQQALQQFDDRRIGLIFTNLPELTATLETPPAVNPPPSNNKKKSKSIQAEPIQTEEIEKAFESLAIALKLNPNGLLANTRLLATHPQTLTPTRPLLSQAVSALRYIPESSILVAAGSDLNQFWNSLQAEVTGYSVLSDLVNQPVKDLKKLWGIDLKEVFQQTQGEYAIAILPRLDKPEPDFIFVTQKTEPELGLRFDEIAQNQGYSVGPFNLAGRTIYAWTKLATIPVASNKQKTDNTVLKAQVQGVRASVDNYEIITSSIEAMDQVINASMAHSILDNPSFMASKAALPANNDGYFYVDWLSGETALEYQLPVLKLVKLLAQPIFENLRSLSISSYGSNDTAKQADILLNFKSL